jgi:hypothetical protein
MEMSPIQVLGSLAIGIYMTWLQRIATVLRLLSASLAIFLIILIGYAWGLAYAHDLFPDVAAWARYERSGSGPWEHNPELSVLVAWIMGTAALWVPCALLAFLFGQRLRDFAMFALAFFGAAAVIRFHFVLID